MRIKLFLIKHYQKSPTFFLLSFTTVISFFFFLWGIDSWRFSYTGDDWPFYIYALKLSHLSYFPDPFSFDGVYFTHSTLVSIYQALFMRILGPSNFAWRLSNIVLIFPSSFFFYRFVKESFGKNIAILSTIILQSSFFLANFFKIGYDNPQGFTLFIISLYIANRLSQHPTRKIAAILGLVLGVSAYAYMGLSFPFFLWPYFLPLVRTFYKKQTLLEILLFVGVYFLFISPILWNNGSLSHLINALGGSSTFPFRTILNDFLLFYKNNDYFYNHFVTGPYLDSISQIFCLIGTLVALSRLNKRKYFFFLMSYISLTVFIGGTSPDWFSPTTRGLFLLPFGFIFAGIGLNFIANKIKNKTFSFLFCFYIICAIFLFNAYQSQIGVFSNPIYNRSGYTGTSLLIRSMMQAKITHQNIIILLSPSLGINTYISLFPYMVKAYDLNAVHYKIVTPDTFACPRNNTNILVFKFDNTAMEKIDKINCMNSSVNYSILTPSITFY